MSFLFTCFVACALLCLTPTIGFSETNRPMTSEPTSATVPMLVEFNRPFVELDFKRADGSTRKARFWVDTGGGGFLFVEPLARDIGMTFGSERQEEGERFAATTPPPASLGGMQLNVEGARASILVGKKSIMPAVEAEGLLPAHLLRRYHVIFDYPGRKFTLAKPGSLKPRGLRVDAPIHQRSGFPRIEVQIAGRGFGFLLDTGASFTMISRPVLETWSKAHPEWPKATGASGAANMGLGQVEANGVMLAMPAVKLASFDLKSVAAISRPEGTFERFMSGMMTQPIIGALGGNVLRAFRVEIDYANGAAYLEKKGSLDSNTDIVALTLRPALDGSFSIAGIVRKNGTPLLEGVNPGDKLIKVGELDVKGASLPQVVDALRGKQGQTRTLLLERDGKQIRVKAPVVRTL